MIFSLGSDFLVRLVVVNVTTGLLVSSYYYHSRHRAHASALMMFSMGVFLVTSLLQTTKVSMGVAFGLFAIFSMLRYRTESISIKEMTYLFLVVVIALLSSVGSMHYLELVAVNIFICLVAWLLESKAFFPLLDEVRIQYDKVDNLVLERRPVLFDDLVHRTGLDIRGVDVLSINLVKGVATLRVHFYKAQSSPSVGGETISEYKDA